MKIVYILFMCVMTLSQAHAFSETATKTGSELDVASLCKEVLNEVAARASCGSKDQVIAPISMNLDRGCSTRFFQKVSGDVEQMADVTASVRWTCETKAPLNAQAIRIVGGSTNLARSK
jgi:hypothetical protein